MRKLSDEEIKLVIENSRWASICTVSEDGHPYAIEATPFFYENEVAFMINPRGGTWKNTQEVGKVLLKYTHASRDLSSWIGVSSFGTGRFVTDKDEERKGWMLLGELMRTDYSKAAERFSRIKNRSPMFAVKVNYSSGRCSSRLGEAMPQELFL